MDRKSWKECISRLGGLTPTPDGEVVPVPEEELQAIEAKCGAKLPDDYREFLATYGASTFSKLTSIRSAGSLPPSLSDDGLLPFGGFYGAKSLEDRWPSVLACADNFHGDIPEGVLPIARGWEDDQICLGLVGDLRGKVFYWDSQGVDEDEEGEDGASAASQNTHYIADSFTDLLDRMERSADATPE